LHTMHLDLTPVWYREVELIGSLGHGMETWPVGTYERLSTFAIAAEMIEQGQIHAEKLITHRFALNNYREALSTATNKSRSRAIKVVFDYSLLPASVVPNVRASARQRRPVTTTAAWPQGDREGPLWSPTPDEEFIRPTPPVAPIPEPIEISTTTLQSLMAEAEQPAPLSDEEHSALEDQSQTIAIPVSKQRRSRQSARSRKTTENVQTSSEAVGNSAEPNQPSETLEK
jgi:hypothetical protein